jgi:hypothetical protein
LEPRESESPRSPRMGEPAMYLLTIEIERDECGYHAVVIDLGDDAVLHVTDSFRSISAAVRAAQRWIEEND